MYKYFVVFDQGHRRHMQDRYDIISDKGFLFGGIYDGHGKYGDEAAVFARDNLSKKFFELLKNGLPPLEAYQYAYQLISDAIVFNETSGTCAVNFYIKDGLIFSANAGDCEMFIIGKKSLNKLTEMHRPGFGSESRHILFSKGIISGHYMYDEYKTFGLAITRSLGDRYLKKYGSLYIPYLNTYKIGKDDAYLLAGTDGLFDLFDYRDLAEELYRYKRLANIKKWLVPQIISCARGNEFSDNLTAMFVDLRF